MARAHAPGKLMLSGEWSVLEVGNPAVVIAVDKGVEAEVEESDSFVFSFPDIGVGEFEADPESLEADAPELKVPLSAAGVALDYISSLGVDLVPFSLTTHSEISRSGSEKIGFGSSAAATVSSITALLAFHGVEPEREKVYKLSALSHYIAQGRVGSGFDIAASTFGGVFLYRRFDPGWLMERHGEVDLDELVAEKWPGFEVMPLSLPPSFKLSVGWTGKGASTSEMVRKVREFKKRDEGEYSRLVSAMASVTERLAERFQDRDAFSLLEENRLLLSELGEKAGVPIETPKLAELAGIARKNGGFGKLSGAGGGDCGIAVSFDGETAAKIESGWREAGIEPLDVFISEEGVTVE